MIGWLFLGLWLASLAGLAGGGLRVAVAAPPADAPTPTLPPQRVEIFQDVNVRAGPGTDYDQVGVLISGQTSPILGRSSDGIWFEIEYIGGPNNTGWVFKDLVHVVGDVPSMPTILAPPTPTLHPTTTPDSGATAGPTSLATQDPNAGRPPTFTAPAPQAQPTLLPAQGIHAGAAFPPAILILGLFVLGSFGTLLSLLRLRH